MRPLHIRLRLSLFLFFTIVLLSSLVAERSNAQSVASSSTGGTRAPVVRTEVAESKIANCGDALSDALGQSGSGMPCWSDIRTVDHWNTLSLERSMTIRGNSTPVIPGSGLRGFSYTAGALSSLLYQSGAHAQAYGGQGAISGFTRMRKWQMTFEDGGTAAGFRKQGAHFVGLNRAAIRASGSAAARWSWQAGGTNSYGNDVLRAAGPLDYRKIGSAQMGGVEAPVTDVVAYGLHAGNILDDQEDAKLDFQSSRRTSLDLSVGHTIRHFEDDGSTANTERVRTELIHSLSQSTALGVFAGGSRQTGPAPCSLAGLGGLGLIQWGSRASLSLSGAVDGASKACGKRVQSTGDLAIYLKAAPRTDLFLSADRDLSGGVVEKAALLNSASAGVRQRFKSSASVRLTGAAIHYKDIVTRAAHTGSFAEADGIFSVGRSFVQETSYRHYQVSGLPSAQRRNVLTFSIWWSPKRSEPELTAHR